MRLYLTPAALGYLSQLILALMITGYFVARLMAPRASRPAHTVLLTGFFACITLLILLFFLDAAFPPTERLYALFLENTVLALGIVLLLQFAYRFPEPLPRRRWEALLVLGLSLFYLWSEAEVAIQRFGLVSTEGHVIFRGVGLDQYLALGLLWAPAVLLRQSLRASARQPQARRSWWSPLRDLWRPQGQAARAARALALVYLLPFGLSLLTIRKTAYALPPEFYQLGLSVGLLVTLAAFATIYVNYLPENTSLMVRLVALTLVTLLAVLGVLGWLITPAYAAHYRPVFPDHRTLRFTPNDAGGYDLSAIPFHFESELGVNLNVTDSNERSSRPASAPLDFDFPFYGQTYSRIVTTKQCLFKRNANARIMQI